ncbi:MAG: hypothetical protein NZZ41_06235 [Candidatus Dojkabacteria bacterium]|nr:hypothetical protein [Candidatus Dojkabacteria bacterium]
MIGKKVEDWLIEIYKNYQNNIYSDSTSINLSKEDKEKLDKSYFESCMKVAKRSIRALAFGGKPFKMFLAYDKDDYRKSNLTAINSSTNNFVINIKPVDLPEDVNFNETRKVYNGAVGMYIAPKDGNKIRVSERDIFMDAPSAFVEKLDQEYKDNSFVNENPVKKASFLLENSNPSDLMASDKFIVEFGINHDYRSVSGSEYALLGGFKSHGRKNNLSYFRTDQNALEDIKFTYKGVGDISSVLSVSIPANEVTEELIIQHLVLKHIYEKGEVADQINVTVVRFALNCCAFWIASVIDLTAPNFDAKDPTINRYASLAWDRLTKYKDQEYSYDRVLNDKGFCYFEADNPFWRGTLYWPGAIVKDIAVYGSPYHLEVYMTRSEMAARRYLLHMIYSRIAEIISEGKELYSINPVMFNKNGDAVDFMNYDETSVLDKNTYNTIRMSKNKAINDLSAVLFLSLVVASLSKQAVKPETVYYASDYIKENFIEKIKSKLEKANSLLSFAFNVNYVIKDSDKSRLARYYFDPLALTVFENAVKKYWEITETCEKALEEDIPLLNV